jgi:selenocysteine lyase/cysteine desulfurase
MRSGARVQTVPFAELANAIDRKVTLVATSHVRANDGRTQDLTTLAEAARSVGARLLVDASHSAGILPLEVDTLGIDYLVAAAYKHLLCPRGVAFLQIATGTRLPAALTASWRGLRPGSRFFTTDLDDIDESGRGLDVSLAWHAWAGARRSLELLGATPVEDRRAWCVGLAEKTAEALGLPPTGSSVLSIPTTGDPERVTSILAERSIVAAVRAGAVRISFHVYNTEDHVEAVADAIGPLAVHR